MTSDTPRERCPAIEHLTHQQCEKPQGHTRRHRVVLAGKTITWE